VFGKPVTIRTHGYDRFEGLLGIVLVESGKPVNRELVEGGWAWHYTAYSKDEALATAEASARAAKAGLGQGKRSHSAQGVADGGKRAKKSDGKVQRTKVVGYPSAASRGETRRAAW
jgi:endonuclease YncB( thermonuclease family)